MSLAEAAISPGHTSPIPSSKDHHTDHKIENSPGTESAKDSGKCSASDTSNNAQDR